MFFSLRKKYLWASSFALCWTGISICLSLPWFKELSRVLGASLSIFLIVFIAIIPGFINAFVAITLYLEKRVKVLRNLHYPPITILIAAYNEEHSIASTLNAIFMQDYDAPIHVIVINDGSSDETVTSVNNLLKSHANLHLIDLVHNGGKASALNHGLAQCTTDIVVTVDADSTLLKDAIRHLVGCYLSSTSNTRAVAGQILVGNGGVNWITKVQVWDYFLGIASIKRVQSFFQGTLVAQGAFSLYDRKTIETLGGWPNMVGEDIVLSWRILLAGHWIGHADDAIAFTACPDTFVKFINQRRRWSRGMIEAFKDHPSILFKPRFSTLYIWWNLLFPLMDIAYVIGFIPGVVLACFGIYWIVGPMTLALFPMAFLLNLQMYFKEKAIFRHEKIKMPVDFFGLIIYVFFYGLVLQPASISGYFSEVFNLRKSWGTK